MLTPEVTLVDLWTKDD